MTGRCKDGMRMWKYMEKVVGYNLARGKEEIGGGRRGRRRGRGGGDIKGTYKVSNVV